MKHVVQIKSEIDLLIPLISDRTSGCCATLSSGRESKAALPDMELRHWSLVRCVRMFLVGAAEIFHLALHAAGGRFRPFFHLYELRRLCAEAGPEAVREACIRAVDCHFAGAFAFLDAAFRACRGEPFLPRGFTLPATWLSSRINEKLYRAFCRLSALDAGHSLARAKGRWLDFQTTDRPSDALRQIAMLTRFAWFQLWRKE